MRIRVIQECPFRSKAKRYRESTAERLDESPGGVGTPEWSEVWYLPTLAARPLQWRAYGGRLNRSSGWRHFESSSLLMGQSGSARWGCLALELGIDLLPGLGL